MTLNEAFSAARKPGNLEVLVSVADAIVESPEATDGCVTMIVDASLCNPIMLSAAVEISSVAKSIAAYAFEAGRLYGRAQIEIEQLEKLGKL